MFKKIIAFVALLLLTESAFAWRHYSHYHHRYHNGYHRHSVHSRAGHGSRHQDDEDKNDEAPPTRRAPSIEKAATDAEEPSSFQKRTKVEPKSMEAAVDEKLECFCPSSSKLKIMMTKVSKSEEVGGCPDKITLKYDLSTELIFVLGEYTTHSCHYTPVSDTATNILNDQCGKGNSPDIQSLYCPKLASLNQEGDANKNESDKNAELR